MDDLRRGKAESLLLAFVLVAAFHAVPAWVLEFLPARRLYEDLGRNGYATLYDALTCPLPLLLCLGAAHRSGLRLGRWRGHALKVLSICVLPVVLTAIVYPFTSRPFSGGRIGSWLISPAAQDLLFAGYLYGLFGITFPGTIHKRFRVEWAVLVTAVFFALWHVPNFWGMSASYVCFQLVYTLVGGAWVMLARQLTGSVIPGLLVHMACNLISWL